MRTFFATGFALPVLALGVLTVPAFADKPVESADAAHQTRAVLFRPAKPAPVQPSQPSTKAAPKQEVKPPAAQQGGATPSKRVLAQQEAIKALAFADGEWRGASKVLRKEGWVAMTETQRVATLADGTLRTIESRGYEKDGRLSFNTFAVISYDPDAKAYSMRSWSKGHASDYPLEISANGFNWQIESSPQLTIRYEAALKNGVWTQTATRVPAKGDPEKYVEFTVKRATAAK